MAVTKRTPRTPPSAPSTDDYLPLLKLVDKHSCDASEFPYHIEQVGRGEDTTIRAWYFCNLCEETWYTSWLLRVLA